MSPTFSKCPKEAKIKGLKKYRAVKLAHTSSDTLIRLFYGLVILKPTWTVNSVNPLRISSTKSVCFSISRPNWATEKFEP